MGNRIATFLIYVSCLFCLWSIHLAEVFIIPKGTFARHALKINKQKMHEAAWAMLLLEKNLLFFSCIGCLSQTFTQYLIYGIKVLSCLVDHIKKELIIGLSYLRRADKYLCCVEKHGTNSFRVLGFFSIEELRERKRPENGFLVFSCPCPKPLSCKIEHQFMWEFSITELHATFF